MKKSIILFAALFAVFNCSFGRTSHDSLSAKPENIFHISTLVIDADVTVILVNSDEAALETTGGKSFKKNVRLWKTGDTLVIKTNKNRNFLAATIYVPASELRSIRVNSKAHVRSLFALQIPNLDVTINGACDFSITNVGEITFSGTDNYSFEEDREVRQLPASFRRKK